ncbi:hypothetical protein AB0H12_11775 [Actinosynnema sp. NPDC023794]
MRRFTSVLGAALIACAVVTAVAEPAQAGQHHAIAVSSARSYTDVREPLRNITTGNDMPVGAWHDDLGRLHVSKAYYTVDLAQFRGAHVFSARAVFTETAAHDCAEPRSTELWLTDDADRPTYLRAPRELTRHVWTGTNTQCVGYPSFDVAATLNQVIAEGRDKATFALRMPGARQWDVAHGRRFAKTVTISMYVNTPPATPKDITLQHAPCDSVVPVHSGWLRAQVTDPDGETFDGRFVVRDVARPDEAREFRSVETASGLMADLPEGTLADGHTYEVTAQADDGDAVSPMSEPCRFTVRLHPPFTGSP